MKFLTITQIFVFISVVSSAHLSKRQTNANNLDNIQNLLQELEKANLDINKATANRPVGESDTPVRDSLAKLFGAFQQMATAYIGVLTSVGKSIGMPIPRIPGNVQYLEDNPEQPIGSIDRLPQQPVNDQPIIIKQIGENIRQLQDSAQEVSKNVQNIFTRQGPVDNFVLLNEMTKFTRLWANQIQDVSEQITKALGGLEAEEEEEYRSSPQSARDIMKNLQKIFDQTVDNFNKSLNKVITPDQPSPGIREEIVKEFKNLLESIQNRMKDVSSQLETISNSIPSASLPVEHREKP